MSGGWQGLDPLQRALRAIAVLAFLAMLGVVVLDPDRSNNSELLFLLFGSILIALGYPFAMKLPGIIGTKPTDPKPPDEGKADR